MRIFVHHPANQNFDLCLKEFHFDFWFLNIRLNNSLSEKIFKKKNPTTLFEENL